MGITSSNTHTIQANKQPKQSKWRPSRTPNYVAESVQGGGAQASKEANKQVAKDGDASVGTRASAAKDAVSDKIDHPPTRARLISTRRLLSTKLLATNKQTYLTTVR